MFHGDASLSSSGGLSVAIPGEIKGYAKAKEMFGNPAVSWESLIQPSIELARKGIPVTFSKAQFHISIFDDRKIFFLFFLIGKIFSFYWRQDSFYKSWIFLFHFSDNFLSIVWQLIICFYLI